MTMLSVRFANALRNGRRATEKDTRVTLLRTLLRKRAAAHNTGDEDLEALLRDQIRWSLPMQRDGE